MSRLSTKYGVANYNSLHLKPILGEFEDGCTNNRTVWETGKMPRCPDTVATDVVPVVMAIYILFTTVLMLILLIAVFR